ncbi:4-hydroxy-tetrahydrodipicolinate reductase [candidate division KSB1 bacterium]
MKTRVCVSGATGWAGTDLVKAIVESDDLELTGAVSPSQKGKNIGEFHDGTIDLTISGSVEEALRQPADVLIDFTRPEAVKGNVLSAIEKQVHAVIGTSGLTEEDYAVIDRLARERNVGVLAAGNFAITAVLLQKFAELAARFVPSWEIIDYSHEHKPDAPSGTARELANRLHRITVSEKAIPIEKTIGLKEARGATLNGSQVHSIRLPGYVLSAEIVFGARDERLSIRHDAGSSAAPYVEGALIAARRVGSFTGLKRGLDAVLDFNAGASTFNG